MASSFLGVLIVFTVSILKFQQ